MPYRDETEGLQRRLAELHAEEIAIRARLAHVTVAAAERRPSLALPLACLLGIGIALCFTLSAFVGVRRVDVRTALPSPAFESVRTLGATPPERLGGQQVEDTAADPQPFDRGAAAAALGAATADLAACARLVKTSGEGHAIVTYAETGRPEAVVIDKGDFVGTPAGQCVSQRLMKATIPPFGGGRVAVGKSFRLR